MKEYRLGSVVRAGAWGMLLGGAAGFALGLLLAPEEGRKIRRRLVYHLEHLAEQVGQVVDQIGSPEAASEARRTGDALVEDARQKAQQIQHDIDALLGEMRRQGTSRSSQTPPSPDR